MALIPDFEIRAINDAQTSENRIHSDAMAKQYGFSGALVSGVNVLGYLSQPLVQAFGSTWLESGIMQVKFVKPAYEDDLVSIIFNPAEPASGDRHFIGKAHNNDGALLAILDSFMPGQLPAPSSLASASSPLSSCLAEQDRPDAQWEQIHLQRTEPDFQWRPSAAENAEHVRTQRDQSPCYVGQSAYIHPYFLLDACNKALMRMFTLPAWIHTASRLTVRKGLRVDTTITVRTTPVQKWRHKGHEFIKLYVAMWAEKQLAVEVEHSAIFRLARPDRKHHT